MLLFLLGSTYSIAQQDAHFTQYFDNMLFVNPAYAGSNDALNITAIHREQWMGFDGRPRATTLGIHSPLKNRHIGIGLSVVHDIVGPIQQDMIYGDFSYTLRFKNTKAKLAFGIKGGINILNSRTDQLFTPDSNDPDLITGLATQIAPNFGAGIYYHTPKWFVGVSAPKFLENKYSLNFKSLDSLNLFFPLSFLKSILL